MQVSASERIIGEVTTWPGIEAGWGSRGEFAFRFGRREVGHLHGDRAAHFNFPKDVWVELKQQHQITPHPVFPNKQGPAERRIVDDTDVFEVIALLRLNYQRLAQREAATAARSGGQRGT